MAKRVDPRPLHAVTSYTVPQLAQTLGVSIATVRNWLKQGLPAMTAGRPILILGSDAKEFLIERKALKKRPLAPDEFYCLSCKAPRKPFARLVQLVSTPGRPARITGFCEVCEMVCSRVVGAAQLPGLHAFFDLGSNSATPP